MKQREAKRLETDSPPTPIERRGHCRDDDWLYDITKNANIRLYVGIQKIHCSGQYWIRTSDLLLVRQAL